MKSCVQRLQKCRSSFQGLERELLEVQLEIYPTNNSSEAKSAAYPAVRMRRHQIAFFLGIGELSGTSRLCIIILPIKCKT